jgi:hypothetical protein
VPAIPANDFVMAGIIDAGFTHRSVAASVVILLYFFSSLFIVMGFMMLFAFHRTRRWEMVLMSFVYSTSGLAAGYSMQWWPLITGFVAAWLLKFAGYDPDRPAKAQEPPSSGGSQPPGST